MTLDFDFVKKIRRLGYKVKIDTNGSFPKRLREMIDLKLVDYIAMDIKGDKKSYSKITGVDIDLKKIEKSIKLVSDFSNSEFRTTIVKRFHDVDKIIKMSEWLNEICDGKPERFFLQGFKKNEKGMVDSDFLNEQNVGERFLEEIKENTEKFFESVEVRV